MTESTAESPRTSYQTVLEVICDHFLRKDAWPRFGEIFGDVVRRHEVDAWDLLQHAPAHLLFGVRTDTEVGHRTTTSSDFLSRDSRSARQRSRTSTRSSRRSRWVRAWRSNLRMTKARR